MSNIFGDFRRLVLAALDDMVEAGTLPPGLDFGRIAIEPPRDPAHGDLATNAAMVLAVAVKENPMALAVLLRVNQFFGFSPGGLVYPPGLDARAESGPEDQ